MAGPRYELATLLYIMARLRDPDTGCPWDRSQDFADIVPSTLEECYELAAAIEAGDYPHLADELGDLLFQVVFYARLGEERGLFDFAAIVDRLARKLLRRHPHVFPDGTPESIAEARDGVAEAEVKARWEEIKAGEREARGDRGVLADVPTALPALVRAQKIQKRAARVGFDWQTGDSRAAVLGQLDAEVEELRAAINAGDREALAEELGGVFFSGVNLARHSGLDAEAVLRAATRKFERRFRAMEQLAGERGAALEALSPEAWEALWQQAKALDQA